MALATLPFCGALLGQAAHGRARNWGHKLAEVPPSTLSKAHFLPLFMERYGGGRMGQVLRGSVRYRGLKRIDLAGYGCPLCIGINSL